MRMANSDAKRTFAVCPCKLIEDCTAYTNSTRSATVSTLMTDAMRTWYDVGGPGGGTWSIWRQLKRLLTVAYIVDAVTRDPVEALEEHKHAIEGEEGCAKVLPEDGEREQRLGQEDPQPFKHVFVLDLAQRAEEHPLERNARENRDEEHKVAEYLGFSYQYT